MSDEKPFIVIGESDEMLIAGKAIMSVGGLPVLALNREPQISPFSPIRGSWVGETLGKRLFCPEGEDTTDDFTTVFTQLQEYFPAFMVSDTVKDSLRSSISLLHAKQVLGIVFASALSAACVDPEHDFSAVPYWQTVVEVDETVPDVVLQENDDFSYFPWSHCWTFNNMIIKLYPSVKPPISDAEQRYLPVSTTCNCLANENVPSTFLRVGPSATWNPKNHRRDIFEATKNFTQKILQSPELF